MTRMLILIAVLAVLAGCEVSPARRVDAAPAELARIRTIAVLPSPERETYVLANEGDAHLPDQVLPTLVAAGDQRTLLGGEERLTKLVQQRGAPVAVLLAADLAPRLTRLGYEARVEAIAWPATVEHPLPDFDKYKVDADAVLVIRTWRARFVAPDLDGAYVPRIYVIATLFGRDRKQVLYRRLHVCCDDASAASSFDDFDAMMSRPGRVSAALAGVAARVAATVAADLGR